MDKREARSILSEILGELRMKPYGELRQRIDHPEAREVTGSSGVVYQLEIQVFWDDKPEKDLRVMVSIDDRGWRSYFPMTNDFILARDGSFVGE